MAASGWTGWRRLREAEVAFEELDGGAEAAAAHVHDEIDGTTAAATLAVVEVRGTREGPVPVGSKSSGSVIRSLGP